MTRSGERKEVDGGRAPAPPPGKGRRVTSMRLIVTLAAVALITVTVIGVGWVAERNARDALVEEIEARLLLEARNLAHMGADALLSEYPELTLCPVVKEIQSGRQDLAFVVVLDHTGTVQGHRDARVLGTEFHLPNSFTAEDARGLLAPGEAFLGTPELLVASVPIVHANGQNLGTALVGLHRSYLEAMVTRSRKELLLFTAGMLGAAIVSALVLMSILLRPIGILRRGLERIGRGDLDTPLRLRDRTELGLLADAVNGMAAELKASQSEMLEKERLGHEMSLARGIQQSLLPSSATVAGPFVVEGSYRAAAEVGGDYYDVFELPDGRVGMVIADVAGKGLGGCLVTSMLAVLIRSLREHHASPAALLVELDGALSGSLQPGVFVTVFYGILDPAAYRLVFASAAHSPLLVCRGDDRATEWYRTRGIPLGAVKGEALRASLEDTVIELGPGDLAVQYTDGINEAGRGLAGEDGTGAGEDEEYGFERLAAAVARHAAGGRRAVMDALHAEVCDWSAPRAAGDDQTVLVISHEGKPQAAPRPATAGTGMRERVLRARRELADMLSGSAHLQLEPALDSLPALGGWVAATSQLSRLPEADRKLVETTLYEVCANIVEHGRAGARGEPIHVWWKPFPRPNNAVCGCFLVCDQGRPFDGEGWRPPDLEDPGVRRRGRGLGMQIIRSSMEQVMYLPGTPAGNLTLLRFEPTKLGTEKERLHA